MKRRLVGCVGLCVLVAVIYWLWISPVTTAYVSLSANRRSTLEFHRWYSGSCVLSCYEDDVCVGTVKLDNGFFEHPMAMFPGPDGDTVLCLSWLDTAYAAFTVDFSERDARGVRIRQDLQEAVDWSAFKVRACTQREVDFTAQYIKMVDPKTLAHLSKERADTDKLRKDMLDFLLTATTNPAAPTHPIKDVDPQILPED